MAAAGDAAVAAWRAALEAATEPAEAAYRQAVGRKMSTDTPALRARDAALVAAWVQLGVPQESAVAATKRGSGAVGWLVEHVPPPADGGAADATADVDDC